MIYIKPNSRFNLAPCSATPSSKAGRPGRTGRWGSQAAGSGQRLGSTGCQTLGVSVRPAMQRPEPRVGKAAAGHAALPAGGEGQRSRGLARLSRSVETTSLHSYRGRSPTPCPALLPSCQRPDARFLCWGTPGSRSSCL